MSSLLFLLDLAAFLIVIAWAYTNDSGLRDGGDKGALGMRTPADRTAAADAGPRWRTSVAQGAGAAEPGVRGFPRPARWSRSPPQSRP